MVLRNITEHLKNLAGQYPVITITGPRQSGKTTLARTVFPGLPYVSLENPDILAYAEEDTRNFLAQYESGAIFDEAQRCPVLFSYLQQVVDQGPKQLRYVLTGSQQFGLRSKISQSLAGRSANCTLLPFAYNEWYDKKGNNDPSLETVLFAGLYPPVLDRALDPSTWYANYIQNYVEKDVRQIVNLHELRTFQLFLRMCAARCGQLLNLSGLASDCGIAVNTAKGWISVLEASYIIFLLQPHFRNFGKRLVKTPKLYFYDTGLLACLLSIQKGESIQTHSMRGPIFEAFVISELKKKIANTGRMDNLYFWRDRAGNEVDVAYDADEIVHAAEIKSAATLSPGFTSGLQKWKAMAGHYAGKSFLIYGGDVPQIRSDATVIPWRKADSVL